MTSARTGAGRWLRSLPERSDQDIRSQAVSHTQSSMKDQLASCTQVCGVTVLRKWSSKWASKYVMFALERTETLPFTTEFSGACLSAVPRSPLVQCHLGAPKHTFSTLPRYKNIVPSSSIEPLSAFCVLTAVGVACCTVAQPTRQRTPRHHPASRTLHQVSHQGCELDLTN
jgi:hypothetical protein